jgi:hypothetical protein
MDIHLTASGPRYLRSPCGTQTLVQNAGRNTKAVLRPDRDREHDTGFGMDECRRTEDNLA